MGFTNRKLGEQQFTENGDLKIDSKDSGWIFGFGVDETDSTYLYVGYIQVGTENWRVMRFELATNNVQYAQGTENGETNWNNRASLTYSKQI